MPGQPIDISHPTYTKDMMDDARKHLREALGAASEVIGSLNARDQHTNAGAWRDVEHRIGLLLTEVARLVG